MLPTLVSSFVQLVSRFCRIARPNVAPAPSSSVPTPRLPSAQLLPFVLSRRQSAHAPHTAELSSKPAAAAAVMAVAASLSLAGSADAAGAHARLNRHGSTAQSVQLRSAQPSDRSAVDAGDVPDQLSQQRLSRRLDSSNGSRRAPVDNAGRSGWGVPGPLRTVARHATLPVRSAARLASLPVRCFRCSGQLDQRYDDVLRCRSQLLLSFCAGVLS
jgi:hypothetical protein